MPVKDRLDRYLAYNRSRIVKAVQSNEEKAVFFFKVVPLLLHVNRPGLPGYSDPFCPCGIVRFNPSQALPPATFHHYFPQSLAENISDSASSNQPPPIQSVKTIGSIGTIAQTEKSDCDYWISLRFADLTEQGLTLLGQKCKAIEEWAMGLGHEIHFFLMDLDQTRDNSFTSRADEESAGSALKLLLKDELFRTHILVAGKMPVWWLCPPGLSEAEYQSFVQALPEKEKINMESFIDLGYISNLPKSEIFGACLWQMNKALDSPFKSVLKFAYLELLMNDQQTLNLFSDRIKQLVTFPEQLKSEDRLPIDDIDPYLLLAKELVAFYQREETHPKRDDFIRACLFMKTLEDFKPQGEGGDVPAPPPTPSTATTILHPQQSQRLQAITARMGRWDLLPQDVKHYLNFPFWSYQDRLTAGARVHQYLGDTYQRLSGYLQSFSQEGRKQTINEEDIAILGRKLSTFYAKKPHKIEYIPSLSRQMMSQADITLRLALIGGKDSYFASQTEGNGLSDFKQLMIKRESHLIRLLTWLVANGILTTKTRLRLSPQSNRLNLDDVKQLVRTMLTTFPLIQFTHISANELLKSETVIQALAVINFAKAPVRGAKNIPITIISTNSYGEYFLHDYENIALYKAALRTLLTKHGVSRWQKNLTVFIPPQAEQHALQALLDQ